MNLLTILLLHICPNEYVFIHVPRCIGSGGGAAILFRKNLRSKQPSSTSFNSLEFVEVLLRTGSSITRIVIIYRPPPSSKNGISIAFFIDEFPYY